MKLLIALLYALTLNFGVNSQDVSCQYSIGFNGSMAYTCLMSINNPNGFDGFTNIGGQHLSGWSDSQVWDVIFTSGVSTNIPQIICQKFSSVQVIDASFPLEIQSLSETTFRGCNSLRRLTINGRIRSIHPNVFQDNFSLTSIDLGLVEMTTLSPSILGRVSDYFGIEAPFVTDLPPDFFTSRLMNLRNVDLRRMGLTQFRREWFRTFTMESVGLSGTRGITEIPPDSFAPSSIRRLRLDNTGLRTLNVNSFNLIESLQSLDLTNTPIEGLDFNILDRSFMFEFRGIGMVCANLATNNFNVNRQQNLATLESCFSNFDSRFIGFSTTGTAPVFNSIRRERVSLGIQTFSDACVIFPNLFNWNPDFEICFGVDGNTRTELYVDGRLRTSRSTPGLLNAGRVEEFQVSWVNGLILVTNALHGTIFIEQIEHFNVRFVGVRQKLGLNASWTIRQLS